MKIVALRQRVQLLLHHLPKNSSKGITVRIQSIDILRGIAILGILFMNVYYHGFFAVGYVSPAITPLSDTLVDLFNGVFVDGRFRSLFCLLFGVGLAIQYQSYKKKDIAPRDAIKPRLKWLMLFGVLHGLFIFGGDVLLLYSVTAWFVLKSLNLPQEQLRKKAVRYLVIGAVLNLSWSALILYFSEPPLVQGSAAFMELYNEWFSSYGSQMIIQSAVAMIIVASSPLWVFWQVAGLMMLGAYLYRSEFFTKGFEQGALIKVIIGAVIFTGLDVTLRLQLAAASTEISALFASVSAVFVALIYTHIVVKLVANGSRIINVFSAPGKLAFSLYISQSIVGAIVLRWTFPEFHLTSTQIDYVYIALAYSAIQIVLARVYLKFFKQGPLEYIWRKAYTRSQHKKKLLTPISQIQTE